MLYLIEINAGTRTIRQHPYSAGPQGRELMEEHVTKMLAAEFIDPGQSDWVSKMVIAP